MWDKTAVIKPPYPLTYPQPSSLPSLFSPRRYFLAAPHPTSLALPGACRSSPFVLPSTPNHVLHLPSLVLPQPYPPPVSFISPSLLRPVLSSDLKAIWWMRLSQTVHRNKVHCCLPCTMRNQLIDTYWHTVYQIELLYHRQWKLCIVL